MGESRLRRLLGHAATVLPEGCAADFFRGKKVLVTGAAGSVGSSVALQLAEQGCATLCLLDHFDHGLIEVCERAQAIGAPTEIVDALCDVRDSKRLENWMSRIQPDVVIHAAALKHVHFGERHPIECVQTNLIGAKNAIHAAAEAGAKDFLLISSDKAASPRCVMGATKRLAELFLIGFAYERRTAMRLKSVRFGNVIGSQGSVTPRFAAQIAAGGPLRITHAEMQRFFMTAEEAVQLILSVVALEPDGRQQAGAYYMDMGEPVSILELGREMVRESGKKITIEFIGLRPGEKLREELFDQYESAASCALKDVYRVVPSKSQAHVSEQDLSELEAVAATMDDKTMQRALFGLLDDRLGRRDAAAG